MAMQSLDRWQPLSRRANPYSAEHGTYGREPSGAQEFVQESFKALVLNPKFACVAAKSAVRNGSYRLGLYPSMPVHSEDASAEALAHDLFEFIIEQPSFDGFSTFVAAFEAPVEGGESEFEARLWKTLQCLHELDVRPWDKTVSDDPDDKEFSFSFCGRAFFLVGLHPGASRLTRRFAFPTIVFNAHAQFEELRREGKFERIQEVIRARDLALQGTPNANLAKFGEASEARQYSGRAVAGDWKCPFHHLVNK